MEAFRLCIIPTDWYNFLWEHLELLYLLLSFLRLQNRRQKMILLNLKIIIIWSKNVIIYHYSVGCGINSVKGFIDSFNIRTWYVQQSGNQYDCKCLIVLFYRSVCLCLCSIDNHVFLCFKRYQNSGKNWNLYSIYKYCFRFNISKIFSSLRFSLSYISSSYTKSDYIIKSFTGQNWGL